MLVGRGLGSGSMSGARQLRESIFKPIYEPHLRYGPHRRQELGILAGFLRQQKTYLIQGDDDMPRTKYTEHPDYAIVLQSEFTSGPKATILRVPTGACRCLITSHIGRLPNSNSEGNCIICEFIYIRAVAMSNSSFHRWFFFFDPHASSFT